MRRKKICIVTCYKDPNYIRARTIRTALLSSEDFNIIVLKNSHKGLLRYPEVVFKLLKTRLRSKPDLYILTFRGYELLPALILIAGNKPLIFDEFINLIEWVVYEHHKIKPDGIIATLLKNLYRSWIHHCRIILADTKPHALYSSNLMDLSINNYEVLPVGADESIFYPMTRNKRDKTFQVFYYGNMLPLHGVKYVLKAAELLRETHDIKFIIVGGKKYVQNLVKKSRLKGAQIEYIKWLSINELANRIAECDLFLGGPFGGTVQSNLVITGKTFQALAMAKAVVVGKTSVRGGFIDKENSIIINQTSAKALAEAVLWSHANKHNLVRIGRQGYNLYEKQYSSAVIKLKLIKIINSI